MGLDIDNVLIELDAPEPPIMDGSSKFFVEALENAGIVEEQAISHGNVGFPRAKEKERKDSLKERERVCSMGIA